MQHRQLGRSGLQVSALAFGTATFGGVGALAKWGSTDVTEASRLLDICLEAGITLIDTADAYSRGRSEEILGAAMAGRRERLLVATKVRFRMGEGPNDHGLSRHHVVAACEASLRRLGTDRIDLYQMHQWDGLTPLEETLEAFDTLVRSGKVRYYGVSNFAGWQLMKTMATARANGFVPPVAQQNLLLAGEPRRGIRADPGGDRPGRRRADLEPAGGRAAVWQVSARQVAGGRRAAPQRLARAAADRRGAALRHDRGAGVDRRGARRLARRGGAGLAARTAERRVGDPRREDRGAVTRATWPPPT